MSRTSEPGSDGLSGGYHALPAEIELSQTWRDARLPAELRLVDGRRCHIVYRGTWTNSNGPDFEGALVDIAGKLLRGSVELHVRASDWYRHGHASDPAYNQVQLHAVYRNDLEAPVRRQDGSSVPTLEVGRYLHIETGDQQGRDDIIASIGPDTGRACLPELDGEREVVLREALRTKGWERMVEKQLRFSQALQVAPPAEVLYRHLAEALGYSHNRDQMCEVASRVPISSAEQLDAVEGRVGILAMLLGVGGFLPLSPALQDAAAMGVDVALEMERIWTSLERQVVDGYATPPDWSLNRVRPANHPVRRLASLADLVSRNAEQGLLGAFLSLSHDGGKAWDEWLAQVEPSIGEGRRQQLIVNILAPFLAAYADAIDDVELLSQAYSLWDQLPGKIRDGIARSARQQIVGRRRFPIRSALEEQGLHQIRRFGCQEARCFECPIARLAVQFESAS